MNTIINIIMIILLLASFVVIAYYIYDYVKYKKQLDTNISTTQAEINSEKMERVTNLKYVVDQVNDINSQIASTAQQTMITQQNLISQANTNQANILSSLNSAVSFSDSNGNNIPLTNLPGSVNPNMELLQNVTAAMGITAKDLNVNGSMKMCSATNPSKCIQFPDNKGNLYLTDMGNGGIILDGTNGSQINNSLNVNGPINMSTVSGTNGGTLIAGNNQLMVNTQMLGVGNFTQTSQTPQATLHINSPNITDNLVNLTNSTGNTVISINNNGAISIYFPDGTLAGTIQTTMHKGTPSLEINASNVVIDGNLQVGGNVVSNNPKKTSPAPSPSNIEHFTNSAPSPCPQCKVCKNIYTGPLQRCKMCQKKPKNLAAPASSPSQQQQQLNPITQIQQQLNSNTQTQQQLNLNTQSYSPSQAPQSLNSISQQYTSSQTQQPLNPITQQYTSSQTQQSNPITQQYTPSQQSQRQSLNPITQPYSPSPQQLNPITQPYSPSPQQLNPIAQPYTSSQIQPASTQYSNPSIMQQTYSSPSQSFYKTTVPINNNGTIIPQTITSFTQTTTGIPQTTTLQTNNNNISGIMKNSQDSPELYGKSLEDYLSILKNYDRNPFTNGQCASRGIMTNN